MSDTNDDTVTCKGYDLGEYKANDTADELRKYAVDCGVDLTIDEDRQGVVAEDVFFTVKGLRSRVAAFTSRAQQWGCTFGPIDVC